MKLIVVLFCYFAVAYSWTSIELIPIDPENPGCVTESVGTMKYGETKTVAGRCVRASCSPGEIHFAGCGKRIPPKGCTLGPVDLSKPYPDCCPKVVCTK